MTDTTDIQLNLCRCGGGPVLLQGGSPVTYQYYCEHKYRGCPYKTRAYHKFHKAIEAWNNEVVEDLSTEEFMKRLSNIYGSKDRRFLIKAISREHKICTAIQTAMERV